MADRSKMRIEYRAEDVRTERFLRRLLEQLGYHPRKIRGTIAPKGQGAAERWVLRQYPDQVRRLRSKGSEAVGLIAVRDADGTPLASRKAEFDDALREAEMAPRGSEERIALPVPAWSIENWLLVLLGHEDVDETKAAPSGQSYKNRFGEKHGGNEGDAAKRAALAWRAAEDKAHWLPSMRDGHAEIQRLDG